MRKYITLVLGLILLSSFRFDLKGPWIETRFENIVLYTRPAGFSDTPSPDSLDIDKILSNQINDLEIINKTLNTNFKAEVKIYLFNHDEAKTKIGTNSGGGAKVKIREMYFAFNKDLADKLADFIGLHEMVHIVAGNEFGYPATTHLMTEGYSNAVSNGYRLKLTENGEIVRTSLEQWMKDFAREDKILSPSEMLRRGDKIHDDLFYPQAGYFIKWMMEKYGVETVNSIYLLNTKKIKKTLYQLTGNDFETIEKEYMKSIEKFK